MFFQTRNPTVLEYPLPRTGTSVRVPPAPTGGMWLVARVIGQCRHCRVAVPTATADRCASGGESATSKVASCRREATTRSRPHPIDRVGPACDRKEVIRR